MDSQRFLGDFRAMIRCRAGVQRPRRPRDDLGAALERSERLRRLAEAQAGRASFSC